MVRVTRRRRVRQTGGSHGIHETYVITLDKDSQRFKAVDAALKAAKVPFQIYPAVNGKSLNLDTLPSIGIGRALFQSRKVGGKPHNLGAIGCFLSHRNLYRDILAKSKGPETQYLIFEDDVQVKPDFLEEFDRRMKNVPEWDVVYFSKMFPVGDNIGNDLIHLKRDPNAVKNHGTWAYIIKEKCIRRLFDLLEHMMDQVDAQINQEFDTMKAYCFNCNFVVTQAVTSTIANMEE